MTARLLDISDLHVNHPANRRVDGLHPQDAGDPLIVAGDVCETVRDVIDTLATLRSRCARVIWCLDRTGDLGPVTIHLEPR